jgi:hypothetical protein
MAGLGACSLQGSIAMQRPSAAPHPSWSVPLTVSVCGMEHAVWTDQSGSFNLAGLAEARCDIVVKGAHTLGNIREGYELLPGLNVVNMGTLLEGDANGDNCVNIQDFSILATWFNSSHAAADFNEDGRVNISDFSLLSMNFGTCGNLPVTDPQ